MLHGIGYHLDTATCRELTFHIDTRHQDKSEYDEDVQLLISPRSLRCLRAAVPPKLCDSLYHVSVGTLSSACIKAIDAYNKRKHVEPPAQPPVEQLSSLTSQLAAARRGQPCWADVAAVCGMKVDEYAVQLSHGLWCRRMNAACLHHITELPRALKRVKR